MPSALAAHIWRHRSRPPNSAHGASASQRGGVSSKPRRLVPFRFRFRFVSSPPRRPTPSAALALARCQAIPLVFFSFFFFLFLLGARQGRTRSEAERSGGIFLGTERHGSRLRYPTRLRSRHDHMITPSCLALASSRTKFGTHKRKEIRAPYYAILLCSVIPITSFFLIPRNISRLTSHASYYISFLQQEFATHRKKERENGWIEPTTCTLHHLYKTTSENSGSH